MKLTNHVLRSHSVGSLNSVDYLDLSNLDLVSLGRLSTCPKLETLILHENRLQDINGLDFCPQLWNLDLGNNQLRSVDGLSRFLALGTLVLSNNELTWSDLVYLRHMHILSLSLHGNLQLEKDPYYRIHVIDCLPNVWMLDGQMITSSDRIQVRQFFQDSALSDKPVRRKLKANGFISSAQKKVDIEGIFGYKAVQLMTTFPKNAILNIETDKKRLQYLVKNMQDDFNLEWQFPSSTRAAEVLQISNRSSILTDLFVARCHELEKSNMVLMLLVASLDFVLPTQLVNDTLKTGKLQNIGSVRVMDLFLLPRAVRCKVVLLLISAVKVDREENETGGLSAKLYQCLYFLGLKLSKLNEALSASLLSLDAKLTSQLCDYKCLLAAEVVQLMCIVPSFFNFLLKDDGVLNMVRIATADSDIKEKLVQIASIEPDFDKTRHDIFKEMTDFFRNKLQEQLQNLTNKASIMTTCDRILSKASALPMKGQNTPVCRADNLVKGIASALDPPPISRQKSAKLHLRFPFVDKIHVIASSFILEKWVCITSIIEVFGLGEKMLLGPQTVGKIISLPQTSVALVIIDGVPGAVEHKLKESEQHYTYVNMTQLDWDNSIKMWKPKGTVGDKFTLQSVDNFKKEAHGSLSEEITSYRPCTPENVAVFDLKPLPNSSPLICYHSPRLPIFMPLAGLVRQPQKYKLDIPRRPVSSVLRDPPRLPVEVHRRAKSAGSSRVDTVPSDLKSSTQKHFQPFAKHIVKDVDKENVSSASSIPKVPSNIGGSINQKQIEAAHGDTLGPIVETEQYSRDLTEEEKQPDASQKNTSEKEETVEHQNFSLTFVTETADTVAKFYPGHQLAGRSRPVSALEKPQMASTVAGLHSDSGYHTEFQKQRMNVWKETTRPASHPVVVRTADPPPPQRPSSPTPNVVSQGQERLSPDIGMEAKGDKIVRPHTGYADSPGRVPKGNLWLAGGRDLFWESLMSQTRPDHIPGWMEGLPDSMKSRASSAASKVHKRPKTPAGQTKFPQTNAGTPGFWNSTPLFSDARQHPPSPVLGSQCIVSQRYYTQPSLYEEDPLPGPIPDDTYSPLTVWSYRGRFKERNNNCEPFLYEEAYSQDLLGHTLFTNTCAAPTLQS